METLIKTLNNAPWWVLIIFAYLIWIGFRARQPRTMSLVKLLIIPLLFLIWSILELTMWWQGLLDILIWIALIAFGFYIGLRLLKKHKVRADHKKKLIRIQGSSILLYGIVFAFCVRLVFGYLQAVLPLWTPGLHMGSIAVTGFLTGFFWSRSYILAKKFANAKPEKLKKNK